MATKRLEMRIVVDLSGCAAQKKYDSRIFRRTHVQTDFCHAADKALSLCGGYEDEASALLKYLQLRAEHMISRPEAWCCIEAIALSLLEKRQLSAGEVEAIICATVLKVAVQDSKVAAAG